MKRLMKRALIVTVISLLFYIGGVSVAIGSTVSAGKFIEDFGDVGTLRSFRGQVRDSADNPVPRARFRILSLTTKNVFEIQADKDGRFEKRDLPSDKYRVEVDADAYNIGEYKLKISRFGLFASGKRILVRLSPGCASGPSGVTLVRKIN
jgi:hypothetical protein